MLNWSKSAIQAQKNRRRGKNIAEKSGPHIDHRANRANRRDLLAGIHNSELTSYMQLKVIMFHTHANNSYDCICA